MKIARIEIQNYKAFRDVEPFDIDGKNVLIYGNNGSGKTSFAHALQALIQSSAKSPEQIQHAFDRTNDENIVNLDTPVDGVSFVRLTTDSGATYNYSLNGNTQADVTLQGANQVSDFMNYRLLFRFFGFRENQDADIFQILYDEFFPYWVDERRNQSYFDWYRALQDDINLLKIRKARRNSYEYKGWEESLEEFNTRLLNKVESLVERSNDFLKIYLAPNEPVQVSFRFIHGAEPEASQKWILGDPVIRLAISYEGKPVNRAHSFLNEARLTALALAIRFAAFEERPQRVSDFKVLVLDDLLISLDMSLRMKVIHTILDSYKQHQLFILTHDKGYFNFLKQALEFDVATWKCLEIYENIIEGKPRPLIKQSEDLLEKANIFLNNNNYDACAVCLRKKAEELIRIFYDPTLELLAQFEGLETLANALEKISKDFHKDRLSQFNRLLDCQAFTLDMVKKLRAETFQGNGLQPAEDGRINTMRNNVLGFVEKYYEHREEYQRERDELSDLARKVSLARSIVLNPGAHQDDVNIYINELNQAYDTLEQFEEKIKNRKW